MLTAAERAKPPMRLDSTANFARVLVAPATNGETSVAGELGDQLMESGASPVREYAEVLGVIAAVTLASWFVPLSYEAFGHIYLFTVIALSLRVGPRPAVAAAIVSAVAWDFVFVPPRLSFSILHFDDVLLLGTYFVVALIGSQLTARVRAQHREQRQRELFAESERLHRTLLDSVSHELKTPLAVLRSATEKLDTDDAKKRTNLAGEIRTATHRLEHLVANLLNQTRLESGALRPQLDWCDARDLIAAARRNADDALAGRALKLDIPADLPLFRADAPLMEHALANVLVNAARYTPADSLIRVSAGVEGSRMFLCVDDNGPGLPPEIAANLFQKFRRGHDARAGGLGLGLSIVRGFMLAQGGEVTAGKSPEGGARFMLYLPYSEHGRVPDDEN